jgi:hypothetical protein
MSFLFKSKKPNKKLKITIKNTKSESEKPNSKLEKKSQI